MPVIVVRLEEPDSFADAFARARAAAGGGAKVVVVADESTAEEAGRLAAEVHGAVFIGDEGLPEFLTELFGLSGSSP